MSRPGVDEISEAAYADAIAFLYNRINFERMPGGAARYPFRLQRIRTLLFRLGLQRYLEQDQPPAVPLVHLAGTKGKGSTAAMIAAGLSAAGLKTGLFTSPHLHHLEERFQIDGQPCSRADLLSLVERLRPTVDQMEQEEVGAPSFFELTTAAALLHFQLTRCQAIVLEVGLGGRLDSTNVCWPSVTAITSIGMDHQRVLGSTLEQIAAEKAGIIKRGIPVVSGVTRRGPADVISQVAEEQQAPLYRLGHEFNYRSEPAPNWGVRLVCESAGKPTVKRQQVSLAMEGKHQARNAAVAIAVLDLLRDQGVELPVDKTTEGIAGVRCPGRIERFELADGVTAIVDTAHNDDSVAALCRCLADRCSERPVCIVFGTSRDKSADTMLERLVEPASDLVLTRFASNPRFRRPSELVPLVPSSFAGQVEVVDEPLAACQAALDRVKPGGVMVICGSFFLAAETREWVQARESG